MGGDLGRARFRKGGDIRVSESVLSLVLRPSSDQTSNLFETEPSHGTESSGYCVPKNDQRLEQTWSRALRLLQQSALAGMDDPAWPDPGSGHRFHARVLVIEALAESDPVTESWTQFLFSYD